MKLPDTIAAIATPPGIGGIGIIRISGAGAVSTAQKLFLSGKTNFDCRHPPPPVFETHRFYLGYLVDPENGDALDQVLLVHMAAPKTYTGEDVVEIHAHAGAFILENILELLFRQGVRLAEPGEFSRRAFLNGKMDLVQVEAVVDLINARNREALACALDHLKGQAGRFLRRVRDQLIDVQSEIEARIDFEDDVETSLPVAKVQTRLKVLFRSIKHVARRHKQQRLFSGESRIVIAGSPNAGKSTLMNLLLQQDRAIVSDTPGTTRDMISETFRLNGIPFVLCDTAGLHDANNPVEQRGIEKTRCELKTANLILYLVDARKGISDSDKVVLGEISSNLILVRNKIDLIGDATMPRSPCNLKVVDISALHGYGKEALKKTISGWFETETTNRTRDMTPTLRQKQLLDKAASMILSGLRRLKQGEKELDMLAVDVRDALNSIQDILGERRNMDVVDSVFERFCIGK